MLLIICKNLFMLLQNVDIINDPIIIKRIKRKLQSETQKGKVFNLWQCSILIVDNLEIFIQDECFTYHIYSITKDMLNTSIVLLGKCTEIKKV